MEYLEKEKSDECIFCTLPKADAGEKNYMLFRGSLCFILMNIFPYNTGHVMVSPYRHLACPTLLDDKESTEMNRLVHHSVEILRTLNSPDGFNIGMNVGKAAGAGFDGHIHTHIVPRWTGDTNFMPVMAETKIYPEHLRKTYERLLPPFRKIKL